MGEHKSTDIAARLKRRKAYEASKGTWEPNREPTHISGWGRSFRRAYWYKVVRGLRKTSAQKLEEIADELDKNSDLSGSRDGSIRTALGLRAPASTAAGSKPAGTAGAEQHPDDRRDREVDHCSTGSSEEATDPADK